MAKRHCCEKEHPWMAGDKLIQKFLKEVNYEEDPVITKLPVMKDEIRLCCFCKDYYRVSSDLIET